jgi:hypothetical protein
MKCVVTENIESRQVYLTDVVIAHVKGEPSPRRPRNVRYLNKETGEKYFCLAGGFAWPGTKPGFACVVAVLDTSDPHAVPFRIIAEVEDNDVQSLIERAYELFEKYGTNARTIPWLWYGESDEGYNSFLYRFNEGLRRAGTKQQFFLVSPPQFELPNRFEFYCRVLYSLLSQGEKRRLFFFPESLLPAYLKNISPADVVTGTTKDHPVISAAGYVVTALSHYEPWLMTLQDQGPGSDSRSFERLMLKEQAVTDRLLRAAFGVDDDSLIFEHCGGIE